ncbi:MAG: hypothetical protein AAGJ79_14990 [Verrucomicrobiota bacterium]
MTRKSIFWRAIVFVIAAIHAPAEEDPKWDYKYFEWPIDLHELNITELKARSSNQRKVVVASMSENELIDGFQRHDIISFVDGDLAGISMLILGPDENGHLMREVGQRNLQRSRTTLGSDHREWLIYTDRPSNYLRDLKMEDWKHIGVKVWETVHAGRKIAEANGGKLLNSR